jgi:hypothetical protein
MLTIQVVELHLGFSRLGITATGEKAKAARQRVELIQVGLSYCRTLSGCRLLPLAQHTERSTRHLRRNSFNTKRYEIGSVVGLTDQGSTYFALNMVLHDQYPSDRCNRRLMIRLQMLAEIAQRTE